MLRRLLRRGPAVGDDTTVLVGPFAGHSGRITERQTDGRFLVVIDECCTPLVAAADLRLVKRSGLADQLGSIHRQIERNPATDVIRRQARQQGVGGGWLEVPPQQPGATVAGDLNLPGGDPGPY